MKEYIKESIKIINSHLIFVVILSITGFFIVSEPFLLIINFILWLIITPVVLGRFTEIITVERYVSYFNIFKKHWFDFYVVSFILILPAFLFLMIFGGGPFWKVGLTFKYVVPAAVNALTLYVMPLVFLKRVNITAIPIGIKYLFNHFKYSLPLVLLTILIHVIKFLVMCLIILTRGNLVQIGILGFLQNFLTLYIFFIVFITASKILLKEIVLVNAKKE